jgi:hypothetical protein
VAPDGRLTPGQTGRLTVGRKLTSTLDVDAVGSLLLEHCLLLPRAIPCLYFRLSLLFLPADETSS